jgi:hypothetical protein
MDQPAYPVQFSVDYPDRQLDRLSTLLRLIYVIPIAIVLQTVSGGASTWSSRAGSDTTVISAGAGGLLIIGPLLMILFRQKYPRWWFDFNLELQRFSSRVGAYVFLMDDRYPSTDDHQSVHVEWVYPDVPRDLNRWLPLIKWLLAIPHYVVLAILYIAVFFALIIVWFAILFTGRYPRALFNFVEGVFRWTNRVVGYAITLVTDEYPPFRLSA